MQVSVKRNKSIDTTRHHKKFKKNDSKDPQIKNDEDLQKIKTQLLEDTKQLPIYKYRKLLQKRLKDVDKLIIVGETGSGKTTQVPKYMYQANLNKHKCIAVTQPRRVAAITLATRVAAEMGSQLGDKVGYNVRFDNMTHEHTSIIFMTDGMLLREALLDPLLSKYGMIVLDEAHERTVETDVLFGIVKKAYGIRKAPDVNDKDNSILEKRKKNNIMKKTELKVLVMSATMNAKQFSDYFDGAGVMQIPGRQHHIENMYLLAKLKGDYLDACLQTVIKIHLEASANEDVLVFLTGQEEIEQAVRQMRMKMKDFKSNLLPLPFYSSLPQHLQMRVFESAPTGLRKVVFSTNLAETSLTIPGIRYVVDSGKSKNRSYNAVSGLDQLKIETVSQAQANQRAGRAGRESDGVCYRIYSKEEFNSFQPIPIPEIKRRNLAGVILQLVFMGINDILSFDFMDKPSPKSVENGVRLLKWLNAVKQEDKLLELTDDGRKMAAFPLDPQFSKVLLEAHNHHCLVEALTIISMLSADSIYVNSSDQRKVIAEAREAFEDPSGDLLMLLNIARQFKKHSHKMQWCEQHFINYRSMMVASEIRSQLKDLCLRQALNVESNRNQDDKHVELRKCFLAGFFMNTARYSVDSYLTVCEGRRVGVHPSSCLYRNSTQPETVFFVELVDTNDVYMRSICSVDFDWIKKMAPSTFQIKPLKRPDNNEIKKNIQLKKMEKIKNKMLKSMMKKEMKHSKK